MKTTMTTAERLERAYLLALSREANDILNELQFHITKLPPARGPRKQILVKKTIKRNRQDKSALANF